MKFKKSMFSVMLAIILVVMVVNPVFAQIDPGDPEYTPVGGVTVAGAIEQLYDLGILPVVTVAAVLVLAVLVYKRFRK